jgi:hypothetical protein
VLYGRHEEVHRGSYLPLGCFQIGWWDCKRGVDPLSLEDYATHIFLVLMRSAMDGSEKHVDEEKRGVRSASGGVGYKNSLKSLLLASISKTSYCTFLSRPHGLVGWVFLGGTL